MKVPSLTIAAGHMAFSQSESVSPLPPSHFQIMNIFIKWHKFTKEKF